MLRLIVPANAQHPQQRTMYDREEIIKTLHTSPQTEEIALVNACLKEVGEVEEATEVAAFLETLEDMVTDPCKVV